MGYIAGMSKAAPFIRTSPADRGTGRQTWQHIFGTTKEGGNEPLPKVRQSIAPGGSWVPGATWEPAYKRLLQAMRSMAPGGWSDDRYEQSKHFLGINYAAIHRCCTQLQQAEFQVFRKDRMHPDGKRPVTEDDPPEGNRICQPYDLVRLLERPNNQDSFGQWFYRINQQKKLTGMGLTWMVPNKLGNPYEMYCVPTAIAIPQPAVNPDFPDGYYRIQPLYPYGPFSSYPTPTTAVGAAIPAEWMLRMLYPHPLLRYDGYSPLTGVKYETDEFEMIGKSRHYKMRRDIRPSAVCQMDEMEGSQTLPEQEINRLLAMFEAWHQGPENAGMLLVSPPGGKLEEWGRTAAEMDYPQSWEQLASFIMGGGHGISKPAAGMVETATYATLYACLKQLHLITLKPDCDSAAADITHRVGPFFGDDLIVEIRCPKIDDHDILFGKLNIAITAKAIKKNQLLKELDLPITDEPWGNDMAGDPSPAEQQQMQSQMMQEQGMAADGQEHEAAMKEAEQGHEQEMALTGAPPVDDGTGGRPKPGKLSQGSLGPRIKALPAQRSYNRIEKFLENTNGELQRASR